MKEFWLAQRKIYPAIFRVLAGLILLFDLIFTFQAGSIIFNPEINSFLSTSRVSYFIAQHYTLFFIIYGLLLLLFITGIGKNFVSFLIWVCYFLFFNTTWITTNWGDLIINFTLLYFAFADSFRYLSFNKSKGKITTISTLALWAVILHLFLIYIDNAYFKLMDRHWIQGVSVYYSFAQYPGYRESLLYSLVEHGFFTKVINYLTITYQLLFVPFVLWKKTRVLIIIVASIFHGVMFFEFGLWKFELFVILLYGFVFTDEEWKRVLPKFVLRGMKI